VARPLVERDCLPLVPFSATFRFRALMPKEIGSI
jgi:hypothetical protein